VTTVANSYPARIVSPARFHARTHARRTFCRRQTRTGRGLHGWTTGFMQRILHALQRGYACLLLNIGPPTLWTPDTLSTLFTNGFNRLGQ